MSNNTNTEEKKQDQNQLAKQQDSASVRFTNMVLREFEDGVGKIDLTGFQRRLAQNFFIGLDMVLQDAEKRRQLKSEKYRDKVPVIWDNINLQKLSRDVVAYARVGLDPIQKNHIFMIPYKNNSTQKYDIGFIEGYRGIEIKATKYGLDVPDGVVVELVYSKDNFKPIKKDIRNKFESYEFEIVDPFDRGDIIGGFYYHIYSNIPEKNKLVMFNIKDIEKRKPSKASPEFWGGEKDVWENGKKSGKEKVEGWYKEMCYKTIYRAAYNDITIDSQKIDDNYLKIKRIEDETIERLVEAEIDQNANSEMIDVDYDDAPDNKSDTDNDVLEPIKEPVKEISPEEKVTINKKKDKKSTDKEKGESKQQNILEGPGF